VRGKKRGRLPKLNINNISISTTSVQICARDNETSGAQPKNHDKKSTVNKLTVRHGFVDSKGRITPLSICSYFLRANHQKMGV
jgi:hypothetical protein